MSVNPEDLKKMFVQGENQQVVFDQLKSQLNSYIRGNTGNNLKLRISILFRNYLNTPNVDNAELFAKNLGNYSEIDALNNDAISHYMVISLVCLEGGARELFVDAFIKCYPQENKGDLAAPRLYAISLYNKAIELLQERDHQEQRQIAQQQQFGQQQQFVQQQQLEQQRKLQQQREFERQQQLEQQRKLQQQQEFERQQQFVQQQQLEQQRKLQQQQEFAYWQQFEQQQPPRPANASLFAMPASSESFGQSQLSMTAFSSQAPTHESVQGPQFGQPPAPAMSRSVLPVSAASSIVPPAPPMPSASGTPLSSASAFFPPAVTVPASLPPAPKVLASGTDCIQDLPTIFAVQSWFIKASTGYISQLPVNDLRRNILEKINHYLQHSKEGLVLTPEEIGTCNSSKDSDFKWLINGIKRVIPALNAMLVPQAHQHKPK